VPNAPRHTRRQPSTILGYAQKTRLLDIPALTASLHRQQARRRQAAQDKQKPPNAANAEGFTNRSPDATGDNGGCGPQRKS
jgi:hypothetical protein